MNKIHYLLLVYHRIPDILAKTPALLVNFAGNTYFCVDT